MRAKLYENKEHFIVVCLNVQYFGAKDKWYFFNRKSSCNGLAGTIKRREAIAILLEPYGYKNLFIYEIH